MTYRAQCHARKRRTRKRARSLTIISLNEVLKKHFPPGVVGLEPPQFARIALKFGWITRERFNELWRTHGTRPRNPWWEMLPIARQPKSDGAAVKGA